MNNIDVILDYFDEVIPNPVCELNYNKDYELLIAVMLSAQTTDKRVNIVTNVLFNKYKSLEELSRASLEDVMDIVKSLGNYKKKACAVIEIANSLIINYEGIVPDNRCYLESLPMVGRKTCNVVLSELFNLPNIAVDTHVKRVSNRLSLSNSFDVLIIENDLKKIINKERWNRFHHQAVLFGRYHCKAVKPLCDKCKLKNICKKSN